MAGIIGVSEASSFNDVILCKCVAHAQIVHTCPALQHTASIAKSSNALHFRRLLIRIFGEFLQV